VNSMEEVRTGRQSRLDRRTGGPLAILLLVIMLLLVAPAFGQQEYISRYDAYVGYAFLDSPVVSLFEHGVQTQVGVRPKTWLALGFDYTYASGDLTLSPHLLTPASQQSLSTGLAQLVAAGVLPASLVMGYNLNALVVPTSSTTQTFAAGPELLTHRVPHVTLFLRPSIGVIYESATPRASATDPVAQAIVKGLAPNGKKTDSTLFFGFGGGVDWNLSKHVILRTQADLVHDHLFKDTLQDARWTVRFSIGPAFEFGKNIAR
jgi:hypothetical protein